MMEGKWFDLLDKMDKVGVPVYSVVTPLEDAGVPTLWFTLGVIVILLGALAVTFVPQRTVHFSIAVTRGGEPLAGATVRIGELTKKTGSSGRVEADVAYGSEVVVSVTHPDCERDQATVPARDDYSASIELKCAT